ncbi:hypothetical protein QQF64_010685 [Cirrhinus molitorella]|uniref:Uncharacterized protein n=1 Tax=Cirrhinus molitorella TaxID=172907 RepID=A0ABR3LZI7_9TELE
MILRPGPDETPVRGSLALTVSAGVMCGTCNMFESLERGEQKPLWWDCDWSESCWLTQCGHHTYGNTLRTQKLKTGRLRQKLL